MSAIRPGSPGPGSGVEAEPGLGGPYRVRLFNQSFPELIEQAFGSYHYMPRH